MQPTSPPADSADELVTTALATRFSKEVKATVYAQWQASLKEQGNWRANNLAPTDAMLKGWCYRLRGDAAVNPDARHWLLKLLEAQRDADSAKSSRKEKAVIAPGDLPAPAYPMEVRRRVFDEWLKEKMKEGPYKGRKRHTNDRAVINWCYNLKKRRLDKPEDEEARRWVRKLNDEKEAYDLSGNSSLQEVNPEYSGASSVTSQNAEEPQDPKVYFAEHFEELKTWFVPLLVYHQECRQEAVRRELGVLESHVPLIQLESYNLHCHRAVKNGKSVLEYVVARISFATPRTPGFALGLPGAFGTFDQTKKLSLYNHHPDHPRHDIRWEYQGEAQTRQYFVLRFQTSYFCGFIPFVLHEFDGYTPEQDPSLRKLMGSTVVPSFQESLPKVVKNGLAGMRRYQVLRKGLRGEGTSYRK